MIGLGLIIGIIQWSCFSQGTLNFQTDEHQLDSMTVVSYSMNDLCFSVTIGTNALTITPSRDNVPYMWQLTEPNSLSQMAQYVGNEMLTPTQFWQAYIDAQFFDARSDLVTGATSLNYQDLSIENGSYTLVLAGCNNLGQRTSGFYTQAFRLPTRIDRSYDLCPQATGKTHEEFFYLWHNDKSLRHIPCSDWDSLRIEDVTERVTLQVEVSQVKKTSATLSVTPSRSIAYYFDYVAKATFESYLDDNAFGQAYVAFLKESYGDQFWELLSYEADQYTFTAEDGLIAGTDYYAIAVAIDPKDSTFLPRLGKQAFSTLKNEYIEGLEFSFKYLEASNSVQITPTLMDQPYVWCLEDEAKVKQYGSPEKTWQADAPIAASHGFIDTGISSCNLTYETWGPGIYYLMVAGYEKGQTSPVFFYKITQK